MASCIEPYFSLQMHPKLELAHRLQTSKMRRSSTSLNICQHDVNIVIICVIGWRCTASINRVSINREFGYSSAAVLLAICKDRPKMAAPIGRSARIRGEFEIELLSTQITKILISFLP